MNLNELTRTENIEDLKRLALLENSDQLESIFDSTEELREHILNVVLSQIGTCAKIIYAALKTIEPEEMTAKEIQDMLYVVFHKKWSGKNMKYFLKKLERVQLIEVRKESRRIYYKLAELKRDK